MCGKPFPIDNRDAWLESVRDGRRHFLGGLAGGVVLGLPLSGLLAGCTKPAWPEGMTPINWERDTCVRCNMVLDDHRFAGQMTGGERNTVFKFCEVGCLIIWLDRSHERFPWMLDPATRMWVPDHAASSGRNQIVWLDPRTSRYVPARSPMGYNFGAVAATDARSLDFAQVSERVLAAGR